MECSLIIVCVVTITINDFNICWKNISFYVKHFHWYKFNVIWKENLNSDNQQSDQYQQNNNYLKRQIIVHENDHAAWRWDEHKIVPR